MSVTSHYFYVSTCAHTITTVYLYNIRVYSDTCCYLTIGITQIQIFASSAVSMTSSPLQLGLGIVFSSLIISG